jgi:dihydroxyacetone kinase
MQSMKKIVNRPQWVVQEMVEGLCLIYPGLRRLAGLNVLVRADVATMRETRVALISGGGSGHEPAHAGYVGRGMLTAAVAGNVFTSPSSDAILAAIRAVAGPPGVLLIVKNYTGDRLNFGLAAEVAKAEGIALETVTVADDVALAASADHAGRRGLAGTILVHKIAGAAAEEGLSIAEVAAEARAAASDVRTMGVALSGCTVPGAPKAGFSLADDEVELGLGIHGEPGVKRAPLKPAKGLVQDLLGPILQDGGWPEGQRVALLVNNLGATTTMELAIVAREAITELEAQRFAVERVYAGTFLSALDMAGVSLSLLPVDETRLARLDAATEAPAWPRELNRPRSKNAVIALLPRGLPGHQGAAESPGPAQLKTSRSAPKVAPIPISITHQVIEELRADEARLNELDQAVGDGDIGSSLLRGARSLISRGHTEADDYPSLLRSAGLALQDQMGGTSGALYGVFFVRASTALTGRSPSDPVAWADALDDGCLGIADLGGAQQGDRTMLDALMPAATAFRQGLEAGQETLEALGAAVAAAEAGAKATAQMVPRKGRSSYLGERAVGHPDPGAEAVVVWLRAVHQALKPSSRCGEVGHRN